MDDGFEDLLDELESDQQMQAGAFRSGGSSGNFSGGGGRPTHVKTDDDFDNLLGELSPIEEKKATPAMGGPAFSKGGDEYDSLIGSLSLDSPAGKQCGPGLKQDPARAKPLDLGQSTESKKSLACVSCDFKVIAWNGYAWSPSVDYLFMRYNYPDYDKLQSNLVPTPGQVAYGCGCSWRNMEQNSDAVAEAIGIQTDCGGGRWVARR